MALKIDPASAQFHHNLGNLYALKHDFDAAIEELKIAVKLSPNLGRIHLTLGLVYAQKNDFDGAIGELGTAVKLDPGDAEAHYYLGCNLAQKGIKYEQQENNKSEALRMFGLARQEGGKAKSLAIPLPKNTLTTYK